MTTAIVPAARLGFLIPSVNVVFEDDARSLLPADVSALIARVRWHPRQSADELVAARRAAAEQIADTRPTTVGFACSSETMISDEETRDVLAGFADLVPASIVPAGAALVERLRRDGARRIAVLTPLETHVAAHEVTFLEDSGFDVVRADVLGIADPAVVADMPPDDIAGIAARWERLSIDAGVILCATFRGVQAAALLTGRLPVPVRAINAVTIEATLAADRARADGTGP